MIDIAIAGGLVVIFSILIFSCRGKNLQLFWPIFLCGSIFTGGILISDLGIFDELLLATAICFLALHTTGVSNIKLHDKWHRLHIMLFSLLMCYLFIESIRGVFIFAEIRKFRWVFFFLALLIFSNLTTRRSYLTPPVNFLCLSLAKANTIFLLIYILCGVYAEFFWGVSRFDLQQPGESTQFLWGTTAYVMFSLVSSIVPITILVKSKNTSFRLWGWWCLIISIMASLYYESRVAMLALSFALLFAIPAIGIKKSILIVLLGLLPILVVSSVFEVLDLEIVTHDFLKIWNTILDPESMEGEANEIDRYAHLLVASKAILESPLTFLFGHGYRVSGSVIGPYLLEVLSQLSPETILKMKNTDFDNVGTEALTAWVVDTGVIGMLLLLSVHMIIVLRAWQSNSQAKLSIIVSVVLCIFWLPIIDFRDITLYYLLLMPDGLLSMFIKDERINSL